MKLRFKVMLLMVASFTVGVLLAFLDLKFLLNQTKISLPEEYMLMNKSTPIKGWYDVSTDSLHIEFDNSIQFIWEGEECTIPQDGSTIIIQQTDENNIYIGPYTSKIKIN